MRNRPSEIDFDFDDLAVAYCKYFRIAEAAAFGAAAFIGDEYPVAVWNKVDVVEIFDPSAIGPATCKIGCAVDSVIERTSKVEVIGDDLSIAARSFAI